MLPVQTSWCKEVFTVEVRAHAHLDTLDVLHKDEARIRKHWRQLFEDTSNIVAIRIAADIVLERRHDAIEFQNIAARVVLQKSNRRAHVTEFVSLANTHA